MQVENENIFDNVSMKSISFLSNSQNSVTPWPTYWK